MQTVREQLVEALERLIDIHENPTHYPLDIQKPSYQQADLALNRARAEPEALLRENGAALRRMGKALMGKGK